MTIDFPGALYLTSNACSRIGATSKTISEIINSIVHPTLEYIVEIFKSRGYQIPSSSSLLAGCVSVVVLPLILFSAIPTIVKAIMGVMLALLLNYMNKSEEQHNEFVINIAAEKSAIQAASKQLLPQLKLITGSLEGASLSSISTGLSEMIATLQNYTQKTSTLLETESENAAEDSKRLLAIQDSVNSLEEVLAQRFTHTDLSPEDTFLIYLWQKQRLNHHFGTKNWPRGDVLREALQTLSITKV